MDTNELLRMGFNQEEINAYMYIYNNGGKFTQPALQSYGYNYEQAKRLAYLNNVCCGKVSISSEQQAVKHLKKMYGGEYKITMQDLAVSKVTEVPRVAVVANIMQSPYNIWNSKNYKGTNALYKVIDVTGQKVTVETSKKPVLKYGQAKVLPGILEIKGVKQNGNAIVTFDKKVCSLCNRFVIVASLRRPEFHLGKFEILCFEGTKVYVYATNMGIKENIKYSMGNQRIYDFGIMPSDIKPKLMRVAKQIYANLKGVSSNFEEANTEYHVVDYKTPNEVNDDIDY